MITGSRLAYTFYKKTSDKSPQIILSSEGIETVNDGFWQWKSIEGEHVITEHVDRMDIDYLEFGFPYGTVNFLFQT